MLSIVKSVSFGKEEVYADESIWSPLSSSEDLSPRLLFKWRLDQNSDIAKIYELHNTKEQNTHVADTRRNRMKYAETKGRQRWEPLCMRMGMGSLNNNMYGVWKRNDTNGNISFYAHNNDTNPSQKCYKMVDYVSDSDFCLKCVKFMNYQAGIVNKQNTRTAEFVSSVRLIKKTSISSWFWES